jgi:hypothetical protein
VRVGWTLFFPTKVFGAKLIVPVYLVSFGFYCFFGWILLLDANCLSRTSGLGGE